jgi:hypothetical protein
VSALSQPHFHNDPEAFKFLESAALPFPRTRPSGTLGDREECSRVYSPGRPVLHAVIEIIALRANSSPITLSR